MGALAETTPLLLGMDWMDPGFLLAEFGQAFFWLSLGIIFVECGLFFPFLPGDTLLFAMGIFIASEQLDLLPGGPVAELVPALVLLVGAAFLGNVVGYEIGRKVGPPLYERNGRIVKQKYFDQTREFFDRHGNKALVLGRFVPFVRTYITVVAGVTAMRRHRFFVWSAIGAALWVLSVTLLGYFLGNVPGVGDFLADNIDYVMLGIIGVSVIPIAYEWWRHRRTSSSGAGGNGAGGVPDRDVTGSGSEPRDG